MPETGGDEAVKETTQAMQTLTVSWTSWRKLLWGTPKGNGIIIIKDVPANVCDQCGEYYVDTQTAIKLEEIVEELRKNRAEVLIINYNEMLA